MKEKIALWSLQKFKRIIREYYDQPYGNKLDNLDAMKKTPKNIKIFKTDSRRNKKSDQNYKEIWIHNLKYFHNEFPKPGDFTDEFYRKYNTSPSHTVSENRRNTSSSFYTASVILIAKPDTTIIRKLQTTIPPEYRCKNPWLKKKNPSLHISKLSPSTNKKDYTLQPNGVYPRNARLI